LAIAYFGYLFRVTSGRRIRWSLAAQSVVARSALHGNAGMETFPARSVMSVTGVS
jgi:hypothetical protein